MAKATRKASGKVIHRFRGIDRSGSRMVYKLESSLALAQRQLKQCAEDHQESRIQSVYNQLTPRNRRKLAEYGDLLLGVPKKK